MEKDWQPGKGYYRYAISVLVMTVALIWWGAATTTKQAGMVFADWPLSLGSVNPPGWLEHLPYFLEHSHRLIASVVGVMTLVLFAWAFLRRPARWLELGVLVVALAVVFGLMISAGAERADAGRKALLWWLAGGGATLIVAWLVHAWLRRGWPLVTRLAALALLLVTLQAILGGVRVTEVSDTFAVVHGCVAHAFFCLLIYIAMVSSPRWQARPAGPVSRIPRWLAVGAPILTVAVVVQLILGALMRHHHRQGLADDGLLRTAGAWVPSFDEPIIAVMFLHKLWAVLLLTAVLALAALAKKQLCPRHFGRRTVQGLAGLFLVQVVLGLVVIASGKNFWITNFHVLNGLGILALSFALSVRCASALIPVSGQAPEGEEQPDSSSGESTGATGREPASELDGLPAASGGR